MSPFGRFYERYALERSLAAAATRSVRMTRFFVAAGEACDRPRSGRKPDNSTIKASLFCERYALERSLAAAATQSVRMTRFFVAAGEACDRPRSGRKTRQLRR